MLRGQIARSDLEELLLTPTFYRLIDPAMLNTPMGLRLLHDEIAVRKAQHRTADQVIHRPAHKCGATVILWRSPRPLPRGAGHGYVAGGALRVAGQRHLDGLLPS
ncbi:hypothetical protein Acsp02_71090 [Actinoplanes sp. NBRC 103695]|nr:hypothetical protein Acsp02_71090 [Actinoplanes sp. NBRC 103695]